MVHNHPNTKRPLTAEEFLQNQPERMFQQPTELLEVLRADRAIDDAVIA
jgi:hypothetical protein